MPYHFLSVLEDLHLTKPLMGIVMLLLVLKFYTLCTLSCLLFTKFQCKAPTFSFQWNKERLISVLENVMQDAHFFAFARHFHLDLWSVFYISPSSVGLDTQSSIPTRL